MSRIKILHPNEIKIYDAPPQFSGEERKSAFHITTVLKENLEAIRTPTNKVGFLLQYAYFKITSRFYAVAKFEPRDITAATKILGYESEQVDLQTKYIRTTNSQHQEMIRTLFGFKPFDEHARNLLVSKENMLCRTHVNPRVAFGVLVEFLSEKRVEGVPYYVIQEVISEAINDNETGLADSLSALLSDEQKEILDGLLEPEPDDSGLSPIENSRSKLTILRTINHSLKPQKIKDSVSRFLFFKTTYEQLLPVYKQMNLSAETIRYFAETAIRGQSFQFKRREDSRFLYLICFVEYQYFRYNDVLIDVFVQSCQNNLNRSRQRHRDELYDREIVQRGTTKESEKFSIQYCEIIEKIGTVLENHTLTLREQNRQIKEIIDAIPVAEIKAKFTKSVESSRTKKHDEEFALILESNSIQLQNRVSRIAQEISFDKESSNAHLFEAVAYFKQKGSEIGNKPPLLFLEESDQDAVFDSEGKLRVSLYKALLFQAMMIGMKSGALNLTYSYRYKNFDSYLIEKERWQREKDELIRQAGLSDLVSFETVIDKLRKMEHLHFTQTNENIIAKKNGHISFLPDGSYRVQTPKVEQIAMPSLSELLPKEQIISLYEVLSAISKASPFLQSFLHWQVKNNKGRPSDQLFLAGIMGYGCNIGINRIANISQGISPRSLENVVNWYFSQENIESANNAILELTNRLQLMPIYKKEKGQTHTSSDGQKFNCAVDSLNAAYSHKYFGTGKGVTVYSFIDESHRLFHSTVITPSERDAAYVIDGIMKNDVVQSSIHSTDTHGYTEIIFGVCHLLGVSFAPRIKKFQEQQLYSILPKNEWAKEGYKILPKGQIDLKLLENHWDDILRFIATIKLKEATASQLFKRLSSYSRQHPLYRALNQFGRIIKSIFLLQYIDDLELRQSIEKQLNKIESSNKFAKAVFYARNQEFYYATREEQSISEGCKRLIENAIICWNYLFLSQKIAQTTSPRMKEYLLEIVRSGSIISWQHINMQGMFDFTESSLANSIVFDLDAIMKFSLAG